MKKIMVIMLSIMMIMNCLTVNVFAADGLNIVIESNATGSVKAGDVVTYTVYLTDCDKVNGITTVSFVLDIPEGLEVVSESSEAHNNIGFGGIDFNEETLELGAYGIKNPYAEAGKVKVLTFKCTVSAAAVAGEKVVTVKDVIAANPSGEVSVENCEGESVTVFVPHVCKLKAVEEVSATCTTDGVKAHYVCEDETCGKIYLDVEGKKAVTATELVIKALGHDFKDGYCQREGCGCAMSIEDIIAALTGYDAENKVLTLEANELAEDAAKEFVEAKIEENLKAILGENYEEFISKVDVKVTSYEAAEAGKTGKVVFTLTITGVAAEGTVAPSVSINGTVVIAALPEEEAEEEKKLGMIFPKLFDVKVECGEGGSVNTSETFKMAYGSSRTIKISADEGYEVADVIVNGKSVGAVEKYTIKGARTTYTVKVLFEEIDG